MSMMDFMGQMGTGAAPDAAPPVDSGSAGPSDGPGWLREAINAVFSYMDVEKDDIDLADAATVLSKLQSILARQQKEQEQALGVSPAVKMLRRQSG